jgi:hypothetical protein
MTEIKLPGPWGRTERRPTVWLVERIEDKIVKAPRVPQPKVVQVRAGRETDDKSSSHPIHRLAA